MLVITKIDYNVNVIFTLVSFFVKMQKPPQNPRIPDTSHFGCNAVCKKHFGWLGKGIISIDV